MAVQKESYVVFPRIGTWVALVLALAFLLGDVAILSIDVSAGLSFDDAWLAIGLVFFGWLFLACLRQIRSPQPVIGLDREAIEGSFGRMPWIDVERISFRWKWMGSAGITRRVVLHRQDGAPEPGRASREYASGFLFGSPRVDSRRVELQAWAYKRRMVSNLRRFYSGPIEA
ncbi:MAG TPA: hypothetical protein VK488_09390 [Gaiellaceae bacterium]|nr:hypothetical protein [Gaiellaceae bacterium]